jgi:predicted ribosome quality control (RQC) complex YloA/Tae2 family protein
MSFVALKEGECLDIDTAYVVRVGLVSEHSEGVWVGLSSNDDCINALNSSITIIAEETTILEPLEAPDVVTYLKRRTKFLEAYVRFQKDPQARTEVYQKFFRKLSTSQLARNTGLSRPLFSKLAK